MTSALDSLLDASFVSGLENLALSEVRARRDQCQGAEGALSFIRRMIQGRLDIAAAALAALNSGSTIDTAELVAQLPTILADDSRSFTPVVRLEAILSNDSGDSYVTEFAAELDDALKDASVDAVSAMTESDLQSAIDRLSALEPKVSTARRKVQEHLDLLQSEIVRRYKSGEASVDSLLS